MNEFVTLKALDSGREQTFPIEVASAILKESKQSWKLSDKNYKLSKNEIIRRKANTNTSATESGSDK